jgi:hypothetical protein
MRMLVNGLAGAGLLLWTLICWLAYGFADGLEDWVSAHATWIAGDAILGSLIETLLNAGQGLGLILTLIIWAIGVVLILVPTVILRKLFGKRRRLMPATSKPVPSVREPQPVFHSSRHVAKGNMISRVMDAAKKYR